MTRLPTPRQPIAYVIVKREDTSEISSLLTISSLTSNYSGDLLFKNDAVDMANASKLRAAAANPKGVLCETQKSREVKIPLPDLALIV